MLSSSKHSLSFIREKYCWSIIIFFLDGLDIGIPIFCENEYLKFIIFKNYQNSIWNLKYGNRKNYNEVDSSFILILYDLFFEV